KNAAAVIRVLTARFATASAEHWLDRIRGAGLWVSPVNRAAELPNDPQTVANGYLTSLDDGWQTPGLPFSLDGYQPPTRSAPAYGEHTTEVLEELGYGEADILSLKVVDAAW
ncbi:MAG TPA: CoA transferase, partial [Dehalococcoidia bacterium]|nr:CoA transferase [Dehalococcoidia bacterium]